MQAVSREAASDPPRTRLRAWFRQHSIVAFFLLSYGITWLGVIPFAFQAFPVPMLPFGPLVAALIVTGVSEGGEGTRRLLMRMAQWRVPARWYVFALLIPVAVTVTAAYANVLLGAGDPTSAIVSALPGALPLFVLMMLNPLQGSLGEELGWRGFALPRMMRDASGLKASLVLGGLVAIWHLPLFVTGMYADAWLLHILFIVTGTVLWTLLYRGTNGSVLLAMVFHSAWNLSPEILLSSFVGADMQRALALYLAGGIAVALVATAVAWPRLTRPTALLAAPAPTRALV